MFRSQQHREKAAAYGELIKHSNARDESDKLQKLGDRHAAIADNEQELANNYDSAVNATERDRASGPALATEEERVLRCLGAAIIMQWNALPKSTQREIFDTAASVDEVLETAALRARRSPASCTSTRMVPIARRLRGKTRKATRNRAPRLCRDGKMREAQSRTGDRSEPTSATGGFPMSPAKRQKALVGPMNTQTARHLTICAALPLIPTPGARCDASPSRKQPNRNDAVRFAKAKISRRRSLKKQREAQKAHR